MSLLQNVFYFKDILYIAPYVLSHAERIHFYKQIRPLSHIMIKKFDCCFRKIVVFFVFGLCVLVNRYLGWSNLSWRLTEFWFGMALLTTDEATHHNNYIAMCCFVNDLFKGQVIQSATRLIDATMILSLKPLIGLKGKRSPDVFNMMRRNIK